MNSRMRKFFSYFKPYMRLFWADMACAFILSVTTLLIPLCVRYVTKNLLGEITPGALQQVYLMGVVMLGLVAIHTVCNIFVGYQGHVMGALMERDIRSELFAHYQKLSFRFYDDQRTGQLMTRLTNDSFDLSELFHHGPEDVVISLLNFVGSFGILFAIDVKMSLIVLLFLPIMAFHAVYFNAKMKRAMRTSKDRIGDINAQVEDTLAGIRVVKSFTNAAIEQAKFGAENQRFVESRRNEYRSESYFYEGLIGYTQLMTIGVIVFGGAAIVHGSLDLADLLTFLLYVGILIEPIKRFGNFTRLYQEGMTGFARIMEILELEPDIEDAPNARELPTVQGKVELQNVSFRYRDEHEHVLHNLCLTVQPGEYVALVGASGVGKSTLCALLPRFYDVQDGQVLIDGADVRSLRVESLRRHIGLVQQDVYLFAGTVAENIGYGRPGASRAQIVTAAQQANAHDFIATLPDGYDTDIGERGVKLSGGQKQRLSIARVFLKDPPIIIFDEATSALDNESEQAVRASMEKLANNRTTLVIAHRLSTVRNAQRIVVLADKGIAEQGTHEELLALNGVYANLYNVQARI
ncbi:MAG: ABC transporter ATP-binding protein [Caldilineaceae bacterium]